MNCCQTLWMISVVVMQDDGRNVHLVHKNCNFPTNKCQNDFLLFYCFNCQLALLFEIIQEGGEGIVSWSFIFGTG